MILKKLSRGLTNGYFGGGEEKAVD